MYVYPRFASAFIAPMGICVLASLWLVSVLPVLPLALPGSASPYGPHPIRAAMCVVLLDLPHINFASGNKLAQENHHLASMLQA